MSSPRPLLLSVFPNFDIGGPQVRFAQLVNHHGRAWRHAIVSVNGRDDCAERISPDLDVSFPKVAMRQSALLANLMAIRRALRAINPDVLVTHNWGSIDWVLANLSVGVRHVHVEDGFGPEERSVQIRRRVLIRRMVLRRSTVILPSLTLMRIARDIWRLPPARLRHVPNAIDLGRFDPPAVRPSAEVQPPRVGVVSALRPEKNLGRLLRAAKLLIDEGMVFRLEIVGGGPERAKLGALAAELGLAGVVTFTGPLQDPSSAYRTFDLFALSSDTEQMPLSVIEAMATGLPVASTRVGDVAQMLATENLPFLCEKDDRAFAASLRPLLRDAGLRRRIGAANRAKAVRDFDERAMFRAYAEVLTPVVTCPPVARPRTIILPI
jgi:glycosyltransferase involved in cell wall biosynthesis